ncbi:MAG: deoxyribodipyrimidine photolyase [Bacteroidetes bacterium]|jgi:deoxyribodipyrimidine photo-lyase|nr:deoxyribodipyrimidine photolyase [Bacteroidota bacterium]
MEKETINIVWFKRDLRLKDHAPLKAAAESENPSLLVYLFEPSLIHDPHYDVRHWRFVWQSLTDMMVKLSEHDLELLVAYEEAETFFDRISDQYDLKAVYSHEETGIDLTYQRDLAMKMWFETMDIEWKEYQTNAVQRGLMHRDGWRDTWKSTMDEPQAEPNLDQLHSVRVSDNILDIINTSIPNRFKEETGYFQTGGEEKAWKLLKSFIHERCSDYNASISAPGPARTGCSRLSPHFTWGNMSIKQAVQYADEHYDDAPSKRGLRSFRSRLGWHCHFIQKFESEPRIEFENMNRGYDDIRREWNEEKFQAWKEGTTGFPMVDACMRSVISTGYLNFRMRAMLVSFLTHHLWLDWSKGSLHLARQFLDFEPGIHYSQFQMQAGTIGVNTIRIYNPIKQGYDHDPDGEFIREWVPELSEVPRDLIHEPWEMSEMEQQMYGCRIGTDYPAPIIEDVKESYKHASKILWSKKGSNKVKEENKGILRKHVKNRR